ncbi:MAG: hypothetical protein WDM79_04915 [Terricaulis sp.]
MPDPIIRELSDVPQMDPGSPTPQVTWNALAPLLLAYQLPDDSTATIAFDLGLACKIGPPNDETLHGHPLYAFGLSHYAASEVLNSPWLAEIRERNRVHDSHSDAMFDKFRHFIWTFHDETFECLAQSYRLII